MSGIVALRIVKLNPFIDIISTARKERLATWTLDRRAPC